MDSVEIPAYCPGNHLIRLLCRSFRSFLRAFEQTRSVCLYCSDIHLFICVASGSDLSHLLHHSLCRSVSFQRIADLHQCHTVFPGPCILQVHPCTGAHLPWRAVVCLDLPAIPFDHVGQRRARPVRQLVVYSRDGPNVGISRNGKRIVAPGKNPWCGVGFCPGLSYLCTSKFLTS